MAESAQFSASAGNGVHAATQKLFEKKGGPRKIARFFGEEEEVAECAQFSAPAGNGVHAATSDDGSVAQFGQSVGFITRRSAVQFCPEPPDLVGELVCLWVSFLFCVFLFAEQKQENKLNFLPYFYLKILKY